MPAGIRYKCGELRRKAEELRGMRNMKRLHIVLIGLISLVMVFLCVVLGISLTRERPTGEGYWNYKLVQEKKFQAEDIQRLKIDYGKGSTGSTDVLFCQGTGEEVVVREYMNYEPKQSQLSAMGQSGGELTIKGSGQSWFSFFSIGFKGAYVEIYLPADFAENMDALTIKTVSGEISSEIGLDIRENLALSTTSGDMRLPEVQAGKIQASSTSGEIRFDSAAAKDLDISTTSGDITVKQARGSTKISSTSGEVRVSALEGPLRTSTTSGDITLGQVTGSITLSTTSGEIKLEEGLEDLDAESTSGDIRVGSLAGSFRMSTTSGELTVSRAGAFGTAHSVSGDIRIFLENLTGDLDISTTSGAVDLACPDTADFRFRFGTTSGECDTFFDEALSFDRKGRNAEGKLGAGTHSVKISTVSGDLDIREFQAGDL